MTPTKVKTKDKINCLEIDSLNIKTAKTTMYIDAVLTKIVALATEVNCKLQCHALISPANASEANITSNKCLRLFNLNA